MDINFELYKIFYHAARLESFSLAGDKLFISQSAVSQAIKNLEAKIGVPLFLRKGRKIRLTYDGELLFKHVEQAYNFIKAGESKMAELKSMNQGEIRIGASDTVCKYHLIPYIQNFSRLYPNIKIQLVNRTSLQIIDTLKNGKIDFGIVTLPVEDKSIIIDQFMWVQDIFVAGERFNDLKNKKVSISSLSSYPLLMLPLSTSTRRNLEAYMASSNVKITPEIELETIDLLVEFAKIGMGIANVLKESAIGAIDRNELFEIQTVEQIPRRALGIITMDKVPLSRSANEFIRILKSDNYC